jgi:hypothetical protein
LLLFLLRFWRKLRDWRFPHHLFTLVPALLSETSFMSLFVMKMMVHLLSLDVTQTCKICLLIWCRFNTLDKRIARACHLFSFHHFMIRSIKTGRLPPHLSLIWSLPSITSFHTWLNMPSWYLSRLKTSHPKQLTHDQQTHKVTDMICDIKDITPMNEARDTLDFSDERKKRTWESFSSVVLKTNQQHLLISQAFNYLDECQEFSKILNAQFRISFILDSLLAFLFWETKSVSL